MPDITQLNDELLQRRPVRFDQLLRDDDVEIIQAVGATARRNGRAFPKNLTCDVYFAERTLRNKLNDLAQRGYLLKLGYKSGYKVVPDIAVWLRRAG